MASKKGKQRIKMGALPKPAEELSSKQASAVKGGTKKPHTNIGTIGGFGSAKLSQGG